MAAGRIFEYPVGEEKTLRVNKDIDSTRFREWLDTLREQYPELEETQQDGKIILQSKKGEGTITLYLIVEVLVHDKKLRDKFERDFPQMAQAVRPGIVSTGDGARPFTYPEGLSDSQMDWHRQGMLYDNEDTLFYDKRNDEKYNLIFFSKRVLKWLEVMKRKYPTLQEKTQDNLIKLKDGTKPGTISLYPNVTVVVKGQLMEMFERDFPQMRLMVQSADLAAGIEGLALNNEQEHPDEPEGEGTLDTPPKPTN